MTVDQLIEELRRLPADVRCKPVTHDGREIEAVAYESVKNRGQEAILK